MNNISKTLTVFDPTKRMDESAVSITDSIANIGLDDGFVYSINNIVDLPFTEENKIIKFLKNRYTNKIFYIWAGQTLLAIHPYEESKVNCEASVDAEIVSINAVISRAWFRLVRDFGNHDQAVVITGESGSGKTYSACLAMKYIASRAQEDNEDILWQVWSSVPLLTAFGNAPTSHNHNSSRFGKLLQLQYCDGAIRGAFIKIYMLEKSRVVTLNDGEGNFHIFRQILESLDEEALNTLHLSKNTTYDIAPKSPLRSAYSETVKALEILNITELDQVLIILATILNFGNIHFELKGDVYSVSEDSMTYVLNTSMLLQVKPEFLIDTLCNVQFCATNISRRSTVYKSACINKEECEERRNTLMKLLYDKLFKWLVSSINSRVCEDDTYKHLGLLDVYGFEVFDHNTFEQLCINYANERLQQHFMETYISFRRNELISEGIEVAEIDISEYPKRLAVIDGPVSIFGILNEECLVKRFNSDLFVNTRLSEIMGGRDHFIGSMNDLNTTFSIIHYAGTVKYDTRTMLQKNRDKVPGDMINFLKECQLYFLTVILGDCTEYCTGKTLVSNFKKSLDDLMQTLQSSDVHYVKCLKPNPYRISDFFDDDFFSRQLAVNGVYELLKLKHQNYPIKLNFEKFTSAFGGDLFNSIQQVLVDDLKVGKNYIYMSEHAYYTFERFRYIKLSFQARKIQSCWLKYHTRRNNAAAVIQRFFKSLYLKRHSVSYDKFIDISKKSGELCLSNTASLHVIVKECGVSKAEQYVMNHRFDAHSEGDQLSLMLEQVHQNMETKKFKRVLFCGDRIVSYNKLAEIPVRMHTSKTCMRYSHLLPQSEMPKGLPDIF